MLLASDHVPHPCAWLQLRKWLLVAKATALLLLVAACTLVRGVRSADTITTSSMDELRRS
jgi:hypothetical protein